MEYPALAEGEESSADEGRHETFNRSDTYWKTTLGRWCIFSD